MRNILGDEGNMEQNLLGTGNSVKVNFGEQVHSFLSNKGTTVNFYGEQGNMHQPPPPPPPLEALSSGTRKYSLSCFTLY